jgi:anti-sigma factor RsiW
MNGRAPITEAELQAYIDGRLDPARTSEIDAALVADPELAGQVARDMRLQNALRDALAGAANEEIPERLRIRTLRAARRQVRSGRLGQLAAAIMLLMTGGAGGWMLAQRDMKPDVTQTQTQAQARQTAPVMQIAGEADNAYRVFAVEKLHPVEVAASNEAHLLQWLSNRLARRVISPDLTSAGFHLIGGRLLPGDGAPCAQLMYEDASGRRLTLFVQAGSGDETAFRIVEGRQTATVAWIDHGFGFAVTAPLGREQALLVANIVFRAFSI